MLTERSQKLYTDVAHLSSGRMCMFTQYLGLCTVREGAWPNTTQTLLTTGIRTQSYQAHLSSAYGTLDYTFPSIETHSRTPYNRNHNE